MSVDGAFGFYKSIIIAKQFTYSKKERLKSRKLIEQLFSNGKSFSQFPVKALYKFIEGEGAEVLQAGVSVGSKRFKKAVDRNRIKRLLREAYRLQKLSLKLDLTKHNKRLIIFFIYIGKELPVYENVFEKMGIVLSRMQQIVQPTKKEE